MVKRRGDAIYRRGNTWWLDAHIGGQRYQTKLGKNITRSAAQELAQLSARLGSDIAFFFATPAAWCTGRGEQVRAVPLGRRLWFVLVCPPVGMATAQPSVTASSGAG